MTVFIRFLIISSIAIFTINGTTYGYSHPRNHLAQLRRGPSKLTDDEIQFAIRKYIPLSQVDIIKSEYQKYLEQKKEEGRQKIFKERQLANEEAKKERENKLRALEKKREEDRLKREKAHRLSLINTPDHEFSISWIFAQEKDTHHYYRYQLKYFLYNGRDIESDYYLHFGFFSPKVYIFGKNNILKFNQGLQYIRSKAEEWKNEAVKRNVQNFNKDIPNFIFYNYSNEYNTNAEPNIERPIRANFDIKDSNIRIHLYGGAKYHFNSNLLTLDLDGLDTLIEITNHELIYPLLQRKAETVRLYLDEVFQ